MTKLGPLFKHFGSKWSGARHYPAPLPGLPIFEPYAGGAGYALRYAHHPVTIWEDDANIRALWWWLINEAVTQAVLDIPVGLPAGTDILSLDLTPGQMFLLKHWQRTNNTGDCWTVSPWGDKPGQWTANTRARVAEQIHAVKHWRLAPIGWDVVGTYFVDPPYQYNYRYRFPADSFDYAALAARVRGVPGGSRVICCEAACSKTGTAPDYLPFVMSHRQVTSRRKASQSHHSAELLWVSGM